MKGFSRRLTLKQCLPALPLLFSIILFGLHFFIGGGRTKLVNDSYAYLAITDGQQVGTPFDSRVFAPFIASVITSATGASSLAAFQILTFVSFIASLLVLWAIIASQPGPILGRAQGPAPTGGQRGSGPRGPAVWQAALLLALGCALAVTFGYNPVMVDPVLLLLACLTALALERGYLSSAVVLSTLAALTKEYGLLLGVASALIAWRRGHRTLSVAGGLLPIIVWLLAVLMGSSLQDSPVDAWQTLLNGMFGYHKYLFEFRGPLDYLKIQYMWAWSVLWPVLVIATGVVISRVRNRTRMSDHEVCFAIMLLALPVLLSGDWGRSLLIAVPFGCAVASARPLARNAQFAALLAIGGLSTALARPFHSEVPPPRTLTLIMTVVSVVSSVLIGIKILRFAPTASSPQLDQQLAGPSPEAATQ